MIELHSDALTFSFPEVHPQAKLTMHFQRTLRIPDDGRTYLAPPSLQPFPLRQIAQGGNGRGGIAIPLYQADAMWILFSGGRLRGYPCAIKIGMGGIVRMDPFDGSGREVYAAGARNPVGLDFNPADKMLWWTDNQVDGLGDDVPPGELNRSTQAGEDFGFPYWNGKFKVAGSAAART